MNEEKVKKIDVTENIYWHVEGEDGVTLLDKKRDALEEMRERVKKGARASDIFIYSFEIKDDKIHQEALPPREALDFFANKTKDGEE